MMVTLDPSNIRTLPLDGADIRNNFPIFRNRSSKNPFTYLDSAATSQTPQQVVDAVEAYYNHYNANVHRSIYAAGEEATEAYESAREKVSNFIGADDSHAVVFTRGATEAINLVAYAWGRNNLREGDEILLTEMEHHSNLVPWQLAARHTGARLKFVSFGDDGTLQNLEASFTEKTKIVSVIHQSNVFGTINPVDKIINLAKSVGAVTLIDAAQSVPHLHTDVTSLNCDFLAFSGHKMLGPTGVGVLCGRTELLEQMEPFLAGGEMIRTVSLETSTWNDVPWKFEAGTPNIAQAIGLGVALEYVSSIGLEGIAAHEIDLLTHATQQLSSIDGLRIIGTAPGKTSVISFTMDCAHPHDISTIIDRAGVSVRAGHHCAQPLMERMGVPATTRASFGMYNTRDEVDTLVAALDSVRELFG